MEIINKTIVDYVIITPFPMAMLYFRISVTNCLLFYICFYPLSFSPKGKMVTFLPWKKAGKGVFNTPRAIIGFLPKQDRKMGP
jgi:hypothetical protein